MTPMTDDELMRQFAAGDALAFERLYTRHQAALYRFVHRLLGTAAAAQADEVFQDAWLKLIQARHDWLPQAQGGASLRTWLFTLAHHRAVDCLRKTGREVSTAPGELPETMAAWVIRQEREGEPTEAFQVEEIEVPEPGAFEIIVRVMAAGVNFNNVWAALGQPVSVFGYADHPEFGHHIGGSDASGVVW